MFDSICFFGIIFLPVNLSFLHISTKNRYVLLQNVYVLELDIPHYCSSLSKNSKLNATTLYLKINYSSDVNWSKRLNKFFHFQRLNFFSIRKTHTIYVHYIILKKYTNTWFMLIYIFEKIYEKKRSHNVNHPFILRLLIIYNINAFEFEFQLHFADLLSTN